MTRLTVTYYTQSMGNGKTTTENIPNKIDYLKPNTVIQQLMKFTCDNGKKNEKTSTNRPALFLCECVCF